MDNACSVACWPLMRGMYTFMCMPITSYQNVLLYFTYAKRFELQYDVYTKYTKFPTVCNLMMNIIQKQTKNQPMNMPLILFITRLMTWKWTILVFMQNYFKKIVYYLLYSNANFSNHFLKKKMIWHNYVSV